MLERYSYIRPRNSAIWRCKNAQFPYVLYGTHEDQWRRIDVAMTHAQPPLVAILYLALYTYALRSIRCCTRMPWCHEDMQPCPLLISSCRPFKHSWFCSGRAIRENHKSLRNFPAIRYMYMVTVEVSKSRFDLIAILSHGAGWKQWCHREHLAYNCQQAWWSVTSHALRKYEGYTPTYTCWPKLATQQRRDRESDSCRWAMTVMLTSVGSESLTIALANNNAQEISALVMQGVNMLTTITSSVLAC